MVSPKVLCISLLVLLQLVACQQRAAKRADSDVKVLSGMADSTVNRSQMQWHATDWPFGVWRGEKLIVAQVAADRLKSLSTRRRRKSSRRRRRRQSRRRRRRRRSSTPTAAPTTEPPPPPNGSGRRRRSSAPTVAPTTEPPLPPNGGSGCPAIRVASVPSPPPPNCKCQAICYMFGDPNFVTFDGKSLRFADSSLNYFWVVKTERVKIQGYATDRGSWIQGVAVGGPFLGSHKLLAYRSSQTQRMYVSWDGQEILKHDNSKFQVPENSELQFFRDKGANWLPPDSVLKEVFAKKFFGPQLEMVLKMWIESNVFVFKLPGKVEILMVKSKLHRIPSVEILVKMPPQGDHGGWCGNFNGDEQDDADNTPDQGALPSSENWFRQTVALVSVDAPPNHSATGALCEGEALHVAAHACSHINEADIRKACIDDTCAGTRFAASSTAALGAADEIAIMKGIQEGVGAMKQCEAV